MVNPNVSWADICKFIIIAVDEVLVTMVLSKIIMKNFY